MKFSLFHVAKSSILLMVAMVLFVGSAAPAMANILKWEKQDCDQHRAEWPEGRNFGKDLEYDLFCSWLKGKTGGVPTGSLIKPTEHKNKYDSGIVAVDREGNVLSLVDLIIRLTNWVLGFVGVVALVAFIYGGYVMVANFGNDELANKGKNVIIKASIGIVVILLSFTAVNALLRAGGGEPGGSGRMAREGISQDFIEATIANLQQSMADLFSHMDQAGDLCPATPLGRKVNVRGCASDEFPVDTDGDGIINFFDRDIDNDGILNENDPDVDGDGVPNEQDFCQDTILFHLARPYDYAPYAQLIKDGKITRDDVRRGRPASGDIPLILPYVKPAPGDEPPWYDAQIKAIDLRAVGCAAYENAQDTDGDGIPNHLDPDMDGDGIPNELDPDNDNDGVPDMIIARPASQPTTSVVQNFNWSARVGDTVILDVKILFPGLFAFHAEEPASFFASLVPVSYAQLRENPENYIWIDVPPTPVGTVLTPDPIDKNRTSFTPFVAGTYRFQLYHRDDTSRTTPAKNGNNDTVVIQILPRTTGGTVGVDPSLQAGELFDKFRRDVLLTCRRLPQTFSVRQICTADGQSGSLIEALKAFQRDPSENQMRALMVEIAKLQNILSTIPKVVAKLTASSTLGSAPLTVAFDASGSTDPFNVGIPAANYRWCIGYTTLEEAANCQSPGPDQPPFAYSGPFVSHTFGAPGVYSVQLQVATAQTIGGLGDVAFSQDPGDSSVKAAMDGYSTIRIVVEPPTANIRLGAEVGGTMRDLTQQNFLKMTLSQARAGVKFSTVGTTDYAGVNTSNLLKSKWDFGDGTVVEEDRLSSEKTHTYRDSGIYKFILELQDNRFSVSRKLLDVIVSSTVADLRILPQNAQGDLTTQFTLDASHSISEVGPVTGYDWEIYEVIDHLNNMHLVDTSARNVTLRGSVVNYTFPRIGEYDVKVLVTSENGDSDIARTRVRVVSRAPTANFNWRIPDNRRPATVFFDASASTDPDPNTELQYVWFVNGERITLVGNAKVPMMGNYTFTEPGDHLVELQVNDRPDGSGVGHKISKTIRIASTLDVDFTATQFSGRPGDMIRFTAISSTAVGYFWDFGDGVREYADGPVINHRFNQSGTFTVNLTVDNVQGEENTISKKVRIAEKDQPIAILRLTVDGKEIEPESRACGSREGIIVDRLSSVNFDGSLSVNTDGTNRGLRYLWSFGDGQTSSTRSALHKFRELTVGADCYEVKLTVYDRLTTETSGLDQAPRGFDTRIAEKSDTSPPVLIRVENLRPIMTGFDVIRPATNVTPAVVPVAVTGAKDPDGRVTEYSWWYYDQKAPAKKLDLHVTSEPKTTFTIPPRDREGVETIYQFVVELRDNDGGRVTNEDILGRSQPITITNGPSLAPMVRFNVMPTRARVGETVTFTSTTRDPLDRYIPTANFVWDFHGDGRYSREIFGPEVKYTYEAPGLYHPRLKVTSDGVSDTYETTLEIFANTERPRAAFLFVKSGNQVNFYNNSTVDPRLNVSDLRYAWDFDTMIDTDGDGIVDNDVDSAQVNPVHIYELAAERDVNVRLTVTDAMGLQDTVVRKVISTRREELGAFGQTVQAKLRAVLTTDPPADPLDRKVYISRANPEVRFIMAQSAGKIKEYHLDTNIYADSTGDGIPDNDIDNRLHESLDTGVPFTHRYQGNERKIRAQLTVVDFSGLKDSMSVDVVITEDGRSPFETSFDPSQRYDFASLVPIVTFTVQEPAIAAGQQITFDASGTSFPDEGIREYQWDFEDDGIVDATTATPTVTHAYTREGTYEVRLGVYSETGLYGEYTSTVLVQNLFADPVADFEYTITDTTVSFTSLSTFDSTIPGNMLLYEWKFEPLLHVDETVIRGDIVSLALQRGTVIVDSTDHVFEGTLDSPRALTPPKGTLETGRKIFDAYLVGTVQPLTLSLPGTLTFDLERYDGFENPEMYYYVLSSRRWERVETLRRNNTLEATVSRLGIFALVDSADVSVQKHPLSPEITQEMSSVARDPVQVFPEYGQYRVTLTVTDATGRKNSRIAVINLQPGVTAVSPQESPQLEEPRIEEPPADIAPVVTEEEPPVVDTEERGGGWWFIIIIGFLGLALLGAGILILTMVKNKILAHQRAEPFASPAPPVTDVEVVEPKPEKAPEEPTAPPSAPEQIQEPAPEGGTGPIPDWLKKK